MNLIKIIMITVVVSAFGLFPKVLDACSCVASCPDDSYVGCYGHVCKCVDNIGAECFDEWGRLISSSSCPEPPPVC